MLSTQQSFIKKNSVLIGCIVLALSVLVLVSLLSTNNKGQETDSRISLRSFETEHLATAELRDKGLGGRSSLARNKAMIFDFSDGTDGRCFWMKDMQFSIDIIWLNNEKKVIKVAENVSPDSYPNTFCANENPRYVIELKANRAQELGITLGSALQL